jgi:ribosomal protein L19E
VIQRHHDKDPNKTLIKQEQGKVTDKRLLSGEKQQVLDLHKQQSSQKSYGSQRGEYKMFIQNGVPTVK